MPTYQNPTFGTITTKESLEDDTADKVVVQNSDGKQGWIDKSTLTIPDATASVKGKIKLAGDLGGTADLPTVPGLSGKQATLVSGTNIKTVNGITLLGSGNLNTPDMDTTTAQTVSGVKTFLNLMLGLRNVANTFTSFFTNTNTASRTYTLPDKDGTVALTSDIDIVEVSKTASFSVALVDAGKTYVINSASAVVVTFPTAMTAGKWWEIISIGTGAVSFVAGASATLISPDSRLKLRTQYSQARIIARASNQGVLGGDIVL